MIDLIQGRSPSLDLDSLYGLGPRPDAGVLRSRQGPPAHGDDQRVGAERRLLRDDNPGFDLPRTSGAQQNTLIPDARNDENLAVGQTHLAFIRFHNRVVDKLAAEGVPAADLFATARGWWSRHYQWMLRTDFLPRITTAPAQGGLRQRPRGRRAQPARRRRADDAGGVLGRGLPAGPQHGPPAYEWNGVFENGGGTLDLCSRSPGRAAASTPTAPCRRTGSPTGAASTRSPPRGRTCSRAATGGCAGTPPGASTPASPTRSPTCSPRPSARRTRPPPTATSPSATSPGPGCCSWRPASRWPPRAFQGPQHQDPHAAQILNGDGKGADLSGLNAAQRDALAKDTPLWFYALREAELNNGRMTGVGGRLVAETFHRAMEGSVISILREPAWRPTLGPVTNRFTMVDLLMFAFQGNRNLLAPVRGSCRSRRSAARALGNLPVRHPRASSSGG